MLLGMFGFCVWFCMCFSDVCVLLTCRLDLAYGGWGLVIWLTCWFGDDTLGDLFVYCVGILELDWFWFTVIGLMHFSLF